MKKTVKKRYGSDIISMYACKFSSIIEFYSTGSVKAGIC